MSAILTPRHHVRQACGYSIPFFDYVKDRPVLTDWAKKRVKADLDSLASTPNGLTRDEGSSPDGREGEEEEEEEVFSRLLSLPKDEAGISQDGLRGYWNLANSRSRDLLVGLDELAPKNRVVGVAGGGEKVDVVKIGGNEIKVRMRSDGTAEVVNDQENDTPAATTIDDVNERSSLPLTQAAKSNAKWDNRIRGTPSDSDLDRLVIEQDETYSGKTVLKLIRRERMRPSRSNVGWDQALLGLCLIVVGVALGISSTSVLSKLGIEL